LDVATAFRIAYFKDCRSSMAACQLCREDNQPTFFDLAVQQRGATNKVLETIAREVDFREAEQRVAGTCGAGGRPACRVGVLLRIMILQHLYGLSDPQVEEQIKDRLSFQRFVQLDAHEAVPDETTICRFRQRLIGCGLHEMASIKTAGNLRQAVAVSHEKVRLGIVKPGPKRDKSPFAAFCRLPPLILKITLKLKGCPFGNLRYSI
jgi:transposase